jgi:thymidylate synthase
VTVPNAKYEEGLMSFKSNKFDDIYVYIVGEIMNCPDFVCSPRGMKINELLARTLVLTNPRDRLVSNPARNAKYGFGVGEFIWYWRERTDLESMVYYNKRMKDFSDDGKHLNSAYGSRMKSRSVLSPWSQWDVAVSTLRSDPDSRRCILHINAPSDQYNAMAHGSKDVPCTLSLQFFIRDNALHLHTVMRSNDAVWGLTYDLFSFTLFQECMLLSLKKYPEFAGLELGTYRHTAASLHIYEHHFDMSSKISFAGAYPRLNPMEPIPSLDKLEFLCDEEEKLRLGKIELIDTREFDGGLMWMAEQLNEHRRKRDAEVR